MIEYFLKALVIVTRYFVVGIIILAMFSLLLINGLRPELGIELSGKVTNPNEHPLPGANVIVKGTAIGSVTGVHRDYVIRIPGDAKVLVVSCMGYVTQEIPIAGRAVIDITMQADTTNLAEVIVITGYWETDKNLNPGDIAKVAAQEIVKQPAINPWQTLQRRMTELQTQHSSGDPGDRSNI